MNALAKLNGVIAITGVRQLTDAEKERVLWEMAYLVGEEEWLIGDATGVDALARQTATANGLKWQLFAKNPELPHKAQGAERSTRMIKVLARKGGTLHAWVNKPAPEGLKPGKSWGKAAGSGTWGTVVIAAGHGLKVELHLLEGREKPDWLLAEQLTLL